MASGCGDHGDCKNPAVTVCWNSNGDDLQGDGLEANLESVFKRFGSTAHIRPLDSPIYPTEKLLALLASRSWKGWTMIEDPKPPVDLREALANSKGFLMQCSRDMWLGNI